MKKLMIAVAMVCAAALSQAATIDWTSASVAYAVAADDVTDNGNYAAATSQKVNRMSSGTYTYVLTLLQAGTSTEIGSASGTIKYASNKFSVAGISIDAAEKGVTYDYLIAITGTQPSITGKTSDTYDYSGATLATTISGTDLKIATTGNTSLDSAVPTSWTISGITKQDPEPTPEPTSGLLMLLGMAGLALRRKQK